MTLCKTTHSSFELFPLSLDKEISVAFDGGNVTSDTGVLLLAKLEDRLGIIERVAKCITDRRQQSKISHTYEEMSSRECIRYAVAMKIAMMLIRCVKTRL
jgi:hypothetical protein